MFFFEKKNQKTFARLVSRKDNQRRRKSFCFFFSRKKAFLYLRLNSSS